jgi:predicted phage terminase large subunit-like protein
MTSTDKARIERKMKRNWVSNKAVVRAAIHQDFGAFVVKVFQTLHPGNEYMHSRHVDAMTYALMQVYRGSTRRLVINVPPRHLKSVCVSIAFVAWALGHNPSLKFACVSYSDKLATDLARQFRKVITSDWYRALFPNVQLCKDTETECETTKGGKRFVVTVGGSFTGRGADIIIIDDVINVEDAQSDKLRHRANEWYRESIIARLDDKAKGAIILVAQRLHEDDLCGQVLRKGGWSHLNLPAIAEEDQEISIGPNAVYRRKMGEVLHPEREPLAVLEEIKRDMRSVAFSAQYQQRPVPPEGNIIKRDWIRWYQTLPIRTPDAQVVQSWDIASTTADTSDWSVCTTWLMIRPTYYLLDVWRGRLQFPDLRHKVIELAREHKPNCLLIEEAGPGLHLVQELRANPVPGVPVPIGILPEKSKEDRMMAQSVRFESGQVYLPEQAPWLAEYLHELLAFPSSRFDDQCDATSQFLQWAEVSNRWMSSEPDYSWLPWWNDFMAKYR